MPIGVYKKTEEYRKKMRLAQIERYKNPKERIKTSLTSKGRKHSEKSKKKISEAYKGRKHFSQQGFQKGHEVSEEFRKRLSLFHKGKVLSEETKRKISEAIRGSKHPLWGKYHSEETKNKIRNTKIKQYKNNPELRNKISISVKELWQGRDYIRKHYGKNNPNWKGGLTEREETLAHKLRVKLKNWANKILERDNYTCQRCKIKFEEKRFIEVHHIKSISEYPDLVLDISNGITLCKNCHYKTESYGRKLKR